MANQGVPGDHELIRAFQQGKIEAFTTLYDRYWPKVFYRVRSRIPEVDVEDVTQEVFIAAMRSLSGFRFEAQFGTWLRTLTSRQIADYYRRRKSLENNMDLDSPEAEHSASLGEHEEHKKLDNLIVLRQGLAEMPEHYREVILLRFADGLKFEEVADAMGQSLEATKSLYRRAITALQRQLENA